jgi:UDP-glucose 4-epimerase
MKAIVLGGNGFIGTHIVDNLLAKGHMVRVFDRLPERFREPIPEVDYSLSDFDDVPMLAEALDGMDIVFHLISSTVPSTSNKDPVYDVSSNLVGTLKLLTLMKDAAVRRIVFLSSGGTSYGIPEIIPIPETHPLRPLCSYGVVKVAIENYLYMYHHLYGMQYVVLRGSNPYGERQGHVGVQGVIGTFMRKVLDDNPVEIWGDGSVVRDFIYVGDLAELCVKAGESNIVGIFNAGSGVGHSINEVVAIVRQTTGKDIKPIYKEARNYDVPKIILDIGAAGNAFGWKPKTVFADGIALTWNWMKK